MSKENKLTRRQFIKTAAIMSAGVAAAGTLGSIPASAAPVPDKWDQEADVVVVGFGGAGGAAAIEAADAGAKVIVLEKTATPGGSTCLCAGIIYAAGTTLQKSEGITDTPDEMYKYWMAIGNGLANPDLVRVMADNAAPTFEWIKGLGAQFYTGINEFGGIPPIQKLEEDKGWGLYYSGAEPDPWAVAVTPAKVRGHVVKPVQPTWPYPPKNPTAPTPIGPTRGTGFFKPLWEGAKSRGVQVLLETRAIELIVDPVKNEVLGIKADSKGAVVNIKAKRGVILTAGGHALNKEFNKIYCQEGIYPTNYTASDTGDGIIMGMAIGAGTTNLEHTLLSVSVLQGAILVNTGGRRFVDETLYRVPSEAWKGQLGWLAWEIGDSVIKGSVTANIIEAPTLKELAEKIKVDPVVLKDTVNFYNKSVAAGKDLEFGKTRRTRHGAPAEMAMRQIATPPFYAVKKDASTLTTSQGITMGGLRINTKAQVLFGITDKPITRLYAAGRTAGGSMGDMYPGSGSAIADALVFGRIAGKTAAGEKPW
jgi:3-oxo-5alpha-steroid 4-dehydrogenase